jgi:hypothetical protein
MKDWSVYCTNLIELWGYHTVEDMGAWWSPPELPLAGRVIDVQEIIHKEMYMATVSNKMRGRTTQVRMALESVVKILIGGEYPPENRPGVVLWLKESDLDRATVVYSVSMMEKVITHDDNVYRVAVHQDGTVSVVCFGCEIVDPACEGEYSNVDALPDWVKERLAVLMLMSPTPPTQDVDGVGRRISDHVFWVYA